MIAANGLHVEEDGDHRERYERHVRHEREGERKVHRAHRDGCGSEKAVRWWNANLPQRFVEREAADRGHRQGRQPQRAEGEAHGCGEERAPEDLSHRIDRADFVDAQLAGLEKVLHARRIHPVVDDWHISESPHEEGPYREDERKDTERVRVGATGGWRGGEQAIRGTGRRCAGRGRLIDRRPRPVSICAQLTAKQ